VVGKEIVVKKYVVRLSAEERRLARHGLSQGSMKWRSGGSRCCMKVRQRTDRPGGRGAAGGAAAASLRQISARLAEKGFTNWGRPYAAMSVSGMLRR
jgi:hypothetical protein